MAGAFELSRFSPYHERAGEFGIEGSQAVSLGMGTSTASTMLTLMDLAYVFSVPPRLTGASPTRMRRRCSARSRRGARTLRRAIASLRAPPGAGVSRHPGSPVQSRARRTTRSTKPKRRSTSRARTAPPPSNACASASGAAGTTDLDAADGRGRFLDELVDLRLVYGEAGRYLPWPSRPTSRTLAHDPAESWQAP